jgi:uncharacterized protein YndB with AHSA1/START domain
VALNSIDIAAPHQAVWSVLADPRLYANWVVGASATRRIEGKWPAVGSVLHHTQALGVSDTTTVLESGPPWRIVMEARIRPVAIMKVSVELDGHGDETHLVLREEVVGGAVAVLPKASLDWLIWLRNRESVRRIKELAEMGHSLGIPEEPNVNEV